VISSSILSIGSLVNNEWNMPNLQGKKMCDALNEKILKPSPHVHKIGQCGMGWI
jgi:hypothetical protein